jgi:predicted enzyme related to lactoylglutathione lyase/uncharacterized protein YciI
MRSMLLTLAAVLLLSIPALAGEEHGAASGPGYYVVQMTLLADPATFESPDVLGGHVQHLISLYDRGLLFMAGPFDDEGNSGQSILIANSAAEARQLAAADPSVAAGILRIDNVFPWQAFFSRPDNRTMTMEQFAAMMSAGAHPDIAPSHGSVSSAPVAASSGVGHEMPSMVDGDIGFTEIPSTSIAESKSFYGELFGWQIDEMTGMEGFAFFSTPGGTSGGFTTMAKSTSDGVVIYINCDGVQATLDRITAAGGSVAMPPMALPENMGHIAHFTDPHGNRVGLWSMAP